MRESYLLDWRLFMTYRLENSSYSEQMQCLGQQKVTCQKLSTFLPHLSLLLKGLAKFPMSLSPRSWMTGQLCFLLIFLSPQLSFFAIVFKESVVWWVPELFVSTKKFRNLNYNTDDIRINETEKIYICIWFGAEYNADLLVEVGVLYSKDHQKPSFPLVFLHR